jgi:Lysyl oxidase
MTSLPRLRIALAASLLALGLGAGAFALLRSVNATAQSGSKVDLPDLVQVVPFKVGTEKVTRRGKTQWRLIFGSAVEVPQDLGPIIVVGHRTSTKTKFLTVDQYIDVIDPSNNQVQSQDVVRNVGRMTYVFAKTHEHFHYLGFDRYELRRVSDNHRVARDRKSGFCLGDRYLISQGRPRAVHSANPELARASVITPGDLDQECRSGHPKSLKVKEGITPGNGDNYKPSLEGQFLDITEVPAGRYYLVHRVNSDRKLHELNYDNDASSALIKVSRSASGRPSVRVLKSCEGTARCQ